ncbi:MAG: MBL fold metallo-hydrolase, partial [Luteimonas sp.]
MHLYPLPAFADNYIWTVRTDATAPALIVDPGESGPVLRAFQDGRPPLAVLLTHHHNDHIGGVADLLRHWPGLRVFAPFDDRIAHATDRVADGDLVSIGDWRFQTLAVPGHTVSHIAFHGHGLLFCGDTLFSLGCGRLF